MKKMSTKELIAEVNRRGQTINAIMELHEPIKILRKWYCTHCLGEEIDGETYQLPYPCPTIQIITDHQESK
jgi:hypothetical protein